MIRTNKRDRVLTETKASETGRNQDVFAFRGGLPRDQPGLTPSLRQSLQPSYNTNDYSSQLERALETRERRTQKAEEKLASIRERNKDLRELNKELTIETGQLHEAVEKQAEQLVWAEEAQEQLGDLEGLIQDQKFDLENKDQEIRRLSKQIDNLKKDVFYKNKNQFEHEFLHAEVEGQRREKELLRARVTQLETEYSHLRIESQAPGKDAADRENHFAKKIYKLENEVNEMRIRNAYLEKSRLREDGVSLKSTLMSKEPKKKRGGLSMLDKERGEGGGDSAELEALRRKVERLEAEKQVGHWPCYAMLYY